MVPHFQYRITWTHPSSKTPKTRVFRQRGLALEHLTKILGYGGTIVAVEERELAPAQWRPSTLGGAR